MTPEMKQQWVEALRSGRYAQAKKNLRIRTSEGDSYCCLGVLCEVVAPNDWRADDSHDISFGGDKTINYVVHEVGLDSRHLDVLVHMNDIEGKTLAEIADYIEREI